MPKTQWLLSGPIASEYGAIGMEARRNTTGETCGRGCTANPRPPGRPDSCPLPPDEKKDKGKDKKYKAFAPAVAGWSEPPAAHL